MRRGMKGAALALVAVVALGAGCSSSSSGSGTSTTEAATGTTAGPSTSTTEGTTGSTAPGSTSVAAPSSEVEAALIEADDLGPTWTRDVSTRAPSESVNESFLDVAACASSAPSGTTAASASSASADYEPDDASTDPKVQIAVQYQVDVYPDEADAAAVVAVLESPGFGSCFESLLTSSSDAGGTVSDLAVSPLEIPSADDLGIDAAVGLEVTATLTTSKGTAATVIHLVALQHGSALGMFSVTVADADGSTPPSVEVNQGAVEAAATKLASLGS